MTQPSGGDVSSGTALGTVLGNTGGGTTNVPMLGDGTPNYGALSLIPGVSSSSTTDSSGALNIWNLPSDLNGVQKIWFDTGHKEVVRDSYNTPGGVVPAQSAGVSSREILRSPVQVMKQFAAMSFNDPGKFVALQKALASGPWGTVYATGAFDSDTEKALGNAMLQYVKLSAGAGVGVSFSDYLLQTAERAQQLGGQGTSAGSGAGSSSPQPQVNLTDPAAIRAAAQSAASAALGRGLSEKQLEQFVTQFQQTQQQVATSTSPTVSAPVLSDQAMQFVQENDPHAYAANKRQSYMNALVDMFAPSGSQRPGMTPVPTA